MPDPALYNGNPLRHTYGPIDNTEQTKQDTNSGTTLTNYHLTPGFAYPQAPIQALSVNQRLEPQPHNSTQPPTKYQNGHSRRLVQQAPCTHEHHQAPMGPVEDSDASSSSEEEDELNNLGSRHINMIYSMPAEGINLNALNFQYAEPISTAISLQIPRKIKKKIWRNQFIDLALLLPRTSISSDNNTNFQLQLSSKAQISLVPNHTRKIFNIETWTSAFLRFMAVYTEMFPMEAPHLLKYTEIVRDLARRSPGLSWYLYDQQFRMLRETVQIPWGRIHTEFWVMASNSHMQRPFRSNFRSSRTQSFCSAYIKYICGPALAPNSSPLSVCGGSRNTDNTKNAYKKHHNHR